jgi:pyruvate dehydrogenase E2 component (dihydrolipoamide acetyltransferase)
MITRVVMEALSPTMEEGRVARWLKQEGDAVRAGDVIAEVETDKAIMELPARGDGVLRRILVPAGGTTAVGNLVAVIAAPDDDIASIVSVAAASAAPAATAAPAASAAPPAVAVHPVVRAAPVAPVGEGAGADRPKASPLARRLARERGIPLAALAGSGPGGRIIKRDIEAAMSAPPVAAVAVAAPVLTGAAPYREETVSPMRAAIARNLVTSIGPVPHFFLTVEIEMDKLLALRKEVNAADESLKLSINDFIVKITAHALMKHPAVNASFQGKTLRYYERADIGVAVAVEDGLITPIVRGANAKTVSEIAAEIREMAGRARNRRLKPEEYTGATFSISNLGMFGIEEFTAVINPPEAAILAVGGVTPKPVVRDGEIVVRNMMRVTMSCDHRVIDGATGAQFLQTLKKLLENPLLLLV